MAAEAVAAEQEQGPEAHDFGEVDFDRVRHLVIVQQGREFLPYSGLVELLHQVSEGYFSIETQLVQAPTQDNAQVAICTARVLIYDPENPDVVRRAATGIGDANPANVNRLMAAHLIRMAETRAKARALRDAVNVGMVSFEELGPGGADPSVAPGPDQPEERAQRQRETVTPSGAPAFTSQPAGSPVGSRPEQIEVEGRLFSRPQVVAIYKGRLAAAEKAGLAVPSDDAGLPDDAPLSMLVGISQAIKRRLDAREGK